MIAASASSWMHRLAAALPLVEIPQTDYSLRPLSTNDLPRLVDVFANDARMSWTGEPYSPENVGTILDLRLRHYSDYDFGIYAVIDKRTGDLIGQVGLQVYDESQTVVELVYFIAPDRWGQGIARRASEYCLHRAFTIANIGVILAATRHYNTSANGLATRLGFHHVGATDDHYGHPALLWILPRDVYLGNRQPTSR